MEQVDDYSSYRASHSNHKNTKIRSIVRRQNKQYNSLAGTSFSNTKVPFTTIIQEPDFTVYDDLKVSGTFSLKHDDNVNQPVRFNGNAFSLIDSIQILVGGQIDVNITQYFQHIVKHLATLKLSETEYAQFKLTTLEGDDLRPSKATPMDFELRLDILGLARKFMPTADLMKIEIKIQFQKNLANIFNSTATTGVVSGYDLEDVHITGDTITYDANVSERILNTFRSAKGVQIPSHSYSCQEQAFSGSLTHHFTPTATYTNLVNSWCVPVLASVPLNTNVTTVASSDFVNVKDYANSDYPKDFLISVGNGGYPANQNGNSRCSNKMSFYNGVLKTVSSTESMKNVAWKLTQQYGDDTYQAVSGSWLKSLDNSPDILNSGINTYLANGQLDVKFNTASVQNTRKLLVINEFTSVLKIAQGQVGMMT